MGVLGSVWYIDGVINDEDIWAPCQLFYDISIGISMEQYKLKELELNRNNKLEKILSRI